MKRLDGKIALVTGASRGIGQATAMKLGREGAHVIVHFNKSEEGAEETVAAIKSQGGQAVAFQADVGTVPEIRLLFTSIDAYLNTVTGSTQFDILVNNAAIIQVAPFLETTQEQHDAQYAVNIRGMFFVAQLAAKRLRDHGRIINLTSIAAYKYAQDRTAYAATKAAILALTRNLAGELSQRFITVNAVAPGAINSAMSPQLSTDWGAHQAGLSQAIQRAGEPEDIADVIACLASEEFRWVTGQIIEASGGDRL
jgi:3-oxoacyl-[acyl-carrier protein] reductase